MTKSKTPVETRKQTSDPTQTPDQNAQTLRDDELDAVTGGSLSSFSNVIKTIGEALNSAARKG